MDNFFNPNHIAVFGSFKKDKLGYQIVESLVKGGFKGKISLISKSKTSIFGLPSYETIRDLKNPVNLAVIAVPKSFVYDVLQDCINTKVKSAVIITSGFSEIGDIESEKRLSESIKNSSIRVIGPNCAGIMNPYAQMYATIEVHTLPGDIGFITQSGAIGGAVAFWAYEKRIGFSKFASFGNKIDVNEIELMNYLAKDDKTKVIAIYVESINNGRAFVEEACEISKIKPIVIIKAGKSVSGKRAASSHTGSMAGEDEIYSSAFDKAGIIRVSGIEEMFDVAVGLVELGSINGPRVSIVTNSGGPGILTADKCEELGLEVPEPGVDLTKRIKPLLLSYASVKNPFDLTVEGTGEQYREVIKESKKEYDSVIAINVPTPYLNSMELAEGIVDAKKEIDIPISAYFSGGEYVRNEIEYLKKNGIAVFDTGERCAVTHASVLKYTQDKKRLFGEKIRKLSDFEKLSLPFSPVVSSNGVKLLNEHQSMEFVRINGIDIPDGGFAEDANDAKKVATDVGFPVVLKMVANDVIHKSDIGGVYLNLNSEPEVEKAFYDAKKKGKDLGFVGVSIYKMLKPSIEFIIGAGRDKQFGPYVVFGMGGIFTEIVHDIIIAIAPVSHKEIDEKLKSLKGYKILKGIRGNKAVDIDSLVGIVVKLSDIICSYNDIKEIDLNPVFVFEKGVVVADARIIL